MNYIADVPFGRILSGVLSFCSFDFSMRRVGEFLHKGKKKTIVHLNEMTKNSEIMLAKA